MYGSLKSPLERQLAKKRHAINASVITNFWGPQIFTRRIMCTKKILCRIWLHQLSFPHSICYLAKTFGNVIMPRQCCFPFQKTFNQEVLPNLVQKTKQTYVLLVLLECVYVISSFDLWMPKTAHDIFALVLNFLEKNWMFKHITIGLFETF